MTRWRALPSPMRWVSARCRFSPHLWGTPGAHPCQTPPLRSSPRRRGTRLQPVQPGGEHRFIPAPAGNARPAARSRRGPPVHPRACGERCSAVRCTWSRTGSSPRLRGTQYRSTSSPANTTVHPRACGERTSYSYFLDKEIQESRRRTTDSDHLKLVGGAACTGHRRLEAARTSQGSSRQNPQGSAGSCRMYRNRTRYR